MSLMGQGRRVVWVEAAHRFDVSVEHDFAFVTDIECTSTPGLPDATHERHFEPDGAAR